MDKDNKKSIKHDEVSLAEELDYEVDFGNFDDVKIEDKPKVETNNDLEVSKTTKEGLLEAQDIMVSIIKKEMVEQAKLGVYDTKLFNLLKDLLKQHEIGLNDKQLQDVQAAFANIKKASKQHIKLHKDEAQSSKLN